MLLREEIFSSVGFPCGKQLTSLTENIDSQKFRKLQKKETFSKVKLSGSFGENWVMWLATCILLLSFMFMYASMPAAHKYCLLNFCCYGKWKSLQENISMTGSIWVKVATHNFQNNSLERKWSTSLLISHIFQRSSIFFVELHFSKVNCNKCKFLLIFLMKLDTLHKKTNKKNPVAFTFDPGKMLLIFFCKEKSKINIEANAYHI